MMIDPEEHVYLVDNRGEQKILKISKSRKCRWRKQTFDLTQVLPHPFQTVFKVDQQGNINKEAHPDTFYFPKDLEGIIDLINAADDSGSDDGKDNRNLNDRNESQKLTQEDITQLKETEQGEEIVKKLVTNSETFAQKTQYSQIKYLSKKKSKYIFNFTVEPVTLRRVHRYWYAESPAKINFLRVDMLSLFLQLRSYVLKTHLYNPHSIIKGLALAGVMERAVPNGGSIKVVFPSMNRGQIKDLQPIAQMNFKDELKSVTLVKAEDITQDEKFTHILIAGEFKFVEILEHCTPTLELGGVLVIYSSFLEAITEAAEFIVGTAKFTQPVILDSFMREQQILPNRTHPMVEMHAFGGYILQAQRLE